MELKEFIKQSLFDICTGISEATEEIGKEINNCPLAPQIFNGVEINDQSREIEFDIAIATSTKSEKSAEGELKTGSIIEVLGLTSAINGTMQNEKTSQSISRIKFKIPFFPGATKRSKKEV